MPNNGEVNREFGMYKTLCCDAELVIKEGAEFPDCPNHPKLPTIWKPVRVERELKEARQNAA